MTLPNRVLMAPMDMNLCEDGEIEETEIAHFVARAAGGTGMISTGASAVAFPLGTTSRKEPGLSDDRFLPGLTALADAIHAAGAKFNVQLVHHGKISRIDTMDGRPMLVPSVPKPPSDMSALTEMATEEMQKMGAIRPTNAPSFKEADADDIAWLIRTFAEAAARVVKAGADSVEIHCAHNYILGGFLSRFTNQRTDEYGGSLENRARLAVEVIKAVVAEVGDTTAVLVRMAGEEYGEYDGLTIEESVQAAKMFEAAGAHAIHVSGTSLNSLGADFTKGPLPNTVGFYADNTAAIKAAVNIPVIAVGRMLPELAEKMIAEGRADFVAMGRQLLAEPDLVIKIKAGHRARVRPCINCYVCVAENFWDATPKCAVNPALGNETLVPFGRTDTPKRVLVIGAGPAGLEAARVATERGHQVVVIDKADRLGGTLWFSSLTTPDNQRLLQWLTDEVKRLGIVVRLKTEATVESVRALNPDVVVVATGAKRPLPDVPGGDLPHVHTGDSMRALLTGTGDTSRESLPLRVMGKLGKLSRITTSPERLRWFTARFQKFLPMTRNVVVIGGSLVGLELANFMAERNSKVTLLGDVEPFGLPMAMPRRWTEVKHARELGISLHRSAEVQRITADEVEFVEDGETRTVPADMVIVATGTSSDTSLADQLTAAGFEVQVAGDAGSVDYIEGAMHTAWPVALGL
ncbi:MAG: FAD-dependent oxidoreductase [Propionibacterium sp.]|nr:FAD-dependent oxidoreductase [Propionibacterium sp.]